MVQWQLPLGRETTVEDGKRVIIGCALDLDLGTVSFSYNGSFEHPMGLAFDNVTATSSLSPAISFDSGSRIKVNLGEKGFTYAPPTSEFKPVWAGRDIPEQRFNVSLIPQFSKYTLKACVAEEEGRTAVVRRLQAAGLASKAQHFSGEGAGAGAGAGGGGAGSASSTEQHYHLHLVGKGTSTVEPSLLYDGLKEFLTAYLTKHSKPWSALSKLNWRAIAPASWKELPQGLQTYRQRLEAHEESKDSGGPDAITHAASVVLEEAYSNLVSLNTAVFELLPFTDMSTPDDPSTIAGAISSSRKALLPAMVEPFLRRALDSTPWRVQWHQPAVAARLSPAIC